MLVQMFKRHAKLKNIMRKISIILILALVGCIILTSNKNTNMKKIAIVIHGGAGTILKKNMTAEMENKYRQKLKEALDTGYKILLSGASAIDAVEASIKVLEDSPLFNAGKGSVFTNNGKNEMDASIMDGKTLNAGAVAEVSTIKNPISAARMVMEKSPHVLLAGKGAEEFAQKQGLEIVSPSYFFDKKRYEQLKRMQKLDHSDDDDGTGYYNNIEDNKFGTVGCVALDINGNLAAGTSTGGMTNKRYGRIGDSPIIGAGTYANNKTCAVSCTGHGEYFIRHVVAYDLSALMEYKNMTLKEAANYIVMDKLKKAGGKGGLIALDRNGNIAMVFNTAGMFRGYKKEDETVIKFYK